MKNDGDCKVIVMIRGFVLVGRVHETEDPMYYRVDDCCIVRRWGTSAGLGQLALEGIQEETILDPEGNGVLVNRRHVLREIPCMHASWKTWKP